MSAPSYSRRQRTAASNASHGSSTITATQAGPSIPFRGAGTLRLRAEPEAEQVADPSTQRRIQWAEDVIDNEGMGKKSSKVCCIYHKPREAGESSEEDSSDSSSSDSDSEPDISRAQPADRRSNRQPHQHHHDDEPCEHDHDQPGPKKAKGKQQERKRSPNAYERVPKRKQPKEPK